MRLTLIRHGTAASYALADAERSLVEAGRRQARHLGTFLLGAGVEFDAVRSSPLVRAVQTAELVVGAMGSHGVVGIDRGLTPESSPSGVLDVLERVRSDFPGANNFALVTHEPFVAAAASLLCGGRLSKGVAKGEAVHLETDLAPEVGGFRLLWRHTFEDGLAMASAPGDGGAGPRGSS